MDKLLIVDDQSGILDMLKRRFVRLGYEVFTTQKSDEALQILEENEIDLVLLDYMMPKITGFDLFVNFHDAYNIPVIMMTAHSSIQLAVEFMKSGGVDFIEKPLDIDVLHLRIARAINHSRQIKVEKDARIKAEAELKNANIALKEKTKILKVKNQELDAFTAIVSHDLKAPARNISSFINLLKVKLKDLNTETKEIFDIIQDSSKQINNMITELLNLAQMNEIDKHIETVDTQILVQGIVDSLQTEHPNTIFEIGNLPSIQAEKILIKQVFFNLIANAVKYSLKSPEPIVKITTQPQNQNETTFVVQDNGAGFDMKYAQRLFGMFVRLHSPKEFEGTGVGLANVKRIIDRHQGKIWAQAEVNKGATFYFTIPNFIETTE